MIEILNNKLGEKDMWLNRYIPYENRERCLKNGLFKLNFVRIELFDDVLEGWNYGSPHLTKAWLNSIAFFKRVLNDGGNVESGKSVIFLLSKLEGKIKNDKILKNEVNNYLDLVHSNFCSCWFVSETPASEERYMWNIYGNSRKELALMISIKWSDLKLELEKSDKTFVCGNIDYSKSEHNNPLFKKHFSYSHEKEFRIITKDYDSDYNDFIVSENIKKVVTFSQPPSTENYTKIKSNLNLEIDELKYSELPTQWELSKIKESLF